MNIITPYPARTMTSREIAELTGKQHKDVLHDIRKMLEDLGLTSADFSADLPDAYGRPQPAFRLPKRECLILVSGYSVQMRARHIAAGERLREMNREAARIAAADECAQRWAAEKQKASLGLASAGLPVRGCPAANQQHEA